MPKEIDEKLATTKLNPDKKSHLLPDVKLCKNCQEKPCLSICPANVYEWSIQKDEIIVKYENCLECGACKIACPKSAIKWQYPRAKYGVTYKKG